MVGHLRKLLVKLSSTSLHHFLPLSLPTVSNALMVTNEDLFSNDLTLILVELNVSAQNSIAAQGATRSDLRAV